MQLRLIIKAKADDAIRAIRKLRADAQGVGRVFQSHLGALNRVNARLQEGNRLLRAAAGYAAAYFGAHTFAQALSAAEDYNRALYGLRQALRAAGGYSDDLADRLARQADALERLTGVSDTQILELHRMLATFGAAGDQILQLTPLVLDLAVAMRADWLTAVRAVGRVLQGQVGSFESLGVQISSYDQLIRILSQRVRGQAAAMHQAAGETARLRVDLNQATEALGRFLAKLSAPVLDRAADSVRALGDSFSRLRSRAETSPAASAAIDALGVAASTALQDILMLVGAFKLLQFAGRGVKGLAGSLRALLAAASGNVAAIARQSGVIRAVGWQLRLLFGSGASAALRFRAAIRLAGTAVAGLGAALIGLDIARRLNRIAVSGRTVGQWLTGAAIEIERAWGALGIRLRGFFETLPAYATEGLNRLLVQVARWRADLIDQLRKIPGAGKIFGKISDPETAALRVAIAEGRIAVAQKQRALIQRRVNQELAEHNRLYDQALDLWAAETAEGPAGGEPQPPKPPPTPSPADQDKALDFIRKLQDEWSDFYLAQAEQIDRWAQQQRQAARQTIKDRAQLQQALDLIDQIAAAKREQADQEALRNRLDLARAELEARAKLIEQDPTLTLRARTAALTQAIQEQLDLYRRMVDAERRVIESAAASDERRIEAARRLIELQQAQVDLYYQLRDLQRQDFVSSLVDQLAVLAREWAAVGKRMADVALGGLKSALDAVADGVWDVVDGVRTWGQIFRDVARQIISNIIRILTQWVASRAMVWALEKLGLLQSTASAVAAAGTTAAAWAPAAVAASIATLGGAAATGTASYLASLGSAQAATTAMTIAPKPFALGGLVDKPTLALLGERGPEYVLRADAVRSLGPAILDQLNRIGSAGAGTAGVPPAKPSDWTAGVPPAKPSDWTAGVPPARQLNLVLVDSRRQAVEALKSAEGEAAIVDVVRRNLVRLGVRV